MEIFNNTTFQTILGAVFGWLLSFISSKPKSEYSSLQIKETKIIIKNEYSPKQNKETTNFFNIIIATLGILGLAVFGYNKHSKSIFEYLWFYEVFTISFIIMTILISLISGKINSIEWLSRIIIPMIIFIATIFIFINLENNIIEKLVEIANKDNVKPFEFIFKLTSFGQKYLLIQLLSFILTLALSLLSLRSFINYFALINLRDDKGFKIWYKIYKHTRIRSSIFYYIISVMIISFTFFVESDWFKYNVLISN